MVPFSEPPSCGESDIWEEEGGESLGVVREEGRLKPVNLGGYMRKPTLRQAEGPFCAAQPPLPVQLFPRLGVLK